MAIGYSLRMCARHVDSTSPGIGLEVTLQAYLGPNR